MYYHRYYKVIVCIVCIVIYCTLQHPLQALQSVHIIAPEQATTNSEQPLQKFMQRCLQIQTSDKACSALDLTALEKQLFALPDQTTINVCDDLSCTPLMYAAEFGSTSMVRWCLNNEAEATAQDSNGQTALMKAAAQGYDRVINILLAHDAHALEQCDQHDWNALTYAVTKNRLATIKLLLQQGISIIKKDSLGRTIAAIATEHGHAHITDDFLQAIIKEQKKAQSEQKKRTSETNSLRNSSDSEMSDQIILVSDTDEGK